MSHPHPGDVRDRASRPRGKASEGKAGPAERVQNRTSQEGSESTPRPLLRKITVKLEQFMEVIPPC